MSTEIVLADGPRMGLARLVRRAAAQLAGPGALLDRLELTISHGGGIELLRGLGRLAADGFLTLDDLGSAAAAFSKAGQPWPHSWAAGENHIRFARLEHSGSAVEVRTSASLRGYPAVVEWALVGPPLDPDHVRDTRRVPMDQVCRAWSFAPEIALNYYGYPAQVERMIDLGAKVVLCYRQAQQNPWYVEQLVALGCRGWHGHAKLITGSVDGRPAAILSSMNLGQHTRRLEQHCLVMTDTLHPLAQAVWDHGRPYNRPPSDRRRDMTVLARVLRQPGR